MSDFSVSVVSPNYNFKIGEPKKNGDPIYTEVNFGTIPPGGNSFGLDGKLTTISFGFAGTDSPPKYLDLQSGPLTSTSGNIIPTKTSQGVANFGFQANKTWNDGTKDTTPPGEIIFPPRVNPPGVTDSMYPVPASTWREYSFTSWGSAPHKAFSVNNWFGLQVPPDQLAGNYSANGTITLFAFGDQFPVNVNFRVMVTQIASIESENNQSRILFPRIVAGQASYIMPDLYAPYNLVRVIDNSGRAYRVKMTFLGEPYNQQNQSKKFPYYSFFMNKANGLSVSLEPTLTYSIDGGPTSAYGPDPIPGTVSGKISREIFNMAHCPQNQETGTYLGAVRFEIIENVSGHDQVMAARVLPVEIRVFPGTSGDIDKNNKIEQADLNLLKLKIARRTTNPAIDDLNGDGQVDNQDVDLLQKILSGDILNMRPQPTTAVEGWQQYQ